MPAPKLPCVDFKGLTENKEKDFGLDAATIRPIWKYAKERYLDNGESMESTINALAAETGAPPRFFQEVLVGPKTIPREKTKEIYAMEDRRRNAKWKAQQDIERADQSGLWKAIRTVGELPRAALTAFHGGVFPVTHGGGLLLVPGEWRTFVRGAMVSWKTVRIPGIYDGRIFYQKARMDLENAPRYANWRQAGLRIGVDERAKGVLSTWFQTQPGWSERAWLGLMRMRYEFAEQSLKGFKFGSDAERMAAMKNIAEIANHATGVTNKQIFGALSKSMFAPQLTASKFLRVTSDPYQTLQTVSKMVRGKDVTPGERAAAYIRMGHAAQMLGTWAAGLMLNGAALAYFGSKQKINWAHMDQADWLRFKLGDGTVLSSRGPEEFLRLFGQIIAVSHASRRELHGKSPWDAAMDRVTRFALYKISPGIGTAAELAGGVDLFGRPLPKQIQTLRNKASLGFLPEQKAQVGKPQYTGPEYAWTHAPIFLTGPARDVYDSMRARGMSEPDAKALVHAAMLTALEFTGIGGYQQSETGKPVPHKGQKPQLIP